ncbi:Aste57867_1841 [Aphanomyces stellatus]|uniref:Aste57867_1841 protein n=1 Tax=Aphanomyces stellatus TaxID=120398 RepID=A0A485K7D9_9STRA|nr:hypothetical protein As57867_001839 [Aphanomyces stellatus]VFT79049.1 Aste57867_1841 [Aphanomyces stellatus]
MNSSLYFHECCDYPERHCFTFLTNPHRHLAASLSYPAPFQSLHVVHFPFLTVPIICVATDRSMARLQWRWLYAFLLPCVVGQITIFSESSYRGTSVTYENNTIVNSYLEPVGSCGIFTGGLAYVTYTEPFLRGHRTIFFEAEYNTSSFQIQSFSIEPSTSALAVLNVYFESWADGHFVQYAVGDVVNNFRGMLDIRMSPNKGQPPPVLIAYDGVNCSGTRTILYDMSTWAPTLVRSFQVVANDDPLVTAQIFPLPHFQGTPMRFHASGQFAQPFPAGATIGSIMMPLNFTLVLYPSDGGQSLRLVANVSKYASQGSLTMYQVFQSRQDEAIVVRFYSSHFVSVPVSLCEPVVVSEFRSARCVRQGSAPPPYAGPTHPCFGPVHVGDVDSIVIQTDWFCADQSFACVWNQIVRSLEKPKAPRLSLRLVANVSKYASQGSLTMYQVFQSRQDEAIVVRFYSSYSCTGESTAYSLHDAIPATSFQFQCLSVNPGVAVVMYSSRDFTGDRIIVTNDPHLSVTRLFDSCASFRVMGATEILSFVRNNDTDAVVAWMQSTTSQSIQRLDVVVPGQDVATIPSPWQVDHLDIPDGTVVQAFRRPAFQGSAIVYLSSKTTTAFIRSFRVQLANSTFPPAVAPDPPAVVTLYSSHDDLDDAFVHVFVGQSVSSFVFLDTMFPGGTIPAVYVSPGVILLAFAELNFQGRRTVVPAGFYSTTNATYAALHSMQSFEVVDALVPLADESDHNNAPVATCGSGSSTRVRFPLDLEYPILHRAIYDWLVVPEGFALVTYDKPWFLGAYQLYTGPLNQSLPTAFRSARCVRQDQAPPPYAGPTYPFYGPLQVGAVDPLVTPTDWYCADQGYACVWKKIVLPLDRLLAGTASGKILIMFHDFNFQGQVEVLGNGRWPRAPMAIRSYKFLSVDAWSGDDDASRATPFVGLFNNVGFDTWPIFMRAGDDIASLIYPWDNHTTHGTVPRGVKVLTFTEPHFAGDCMAWTNDTNLTKTWANNNIRSLRVRAVDDVIKCNKATTPSTTPRPTTQRPSTTNATATPTPVHDDVIIDESTTSMPHATQHSITNLPTNQTGSNEREVGRLNQTAWMDESEIVPMLPSLTSSATPVPLHASSAHPPPRQHNNTPTPDPASSEGHDMPSENPPLKKQRLANHLAFHLALGVGVLAGVVFGSFLVYRLRRRQLVNVSPTGATAATPAIDYSTLVWDDLDLLKFDLPNFPLGQPLEVGASGAIFLGKFEQQSVAIKTLVDPSPSPTQVQAFIDEILLLGKLKSPFLVTLIGVAWTQPTNLQCVMEYMNLGDLRQYLAATTPETYSWQDKLACAHSIAHGLFALHTQHLIHRDLKSRNVLLDSDKGTKLSDFGSSKEIVYGDTMTAAVGTYRWMAPEMLLFQGYSNAVDIYSFGVVLSELSTHQVPYTNLKDIGGREWSDEAITRQVIHDQLRPTFEPDCPVWFVALAMRCMAQDPNNRPSAIQIMHEMSKYTPKQARW